MRATFNLAEGRRFGGLLLLAGALALGACGGGGTTVNGYTPGRLVAYGDESSLIVDLNNNGNGAKYSVNATVSATNSTLTCAASPLWIQVLADHYGLVFPQCNQFGAIATVGRIRATFGGQAADLAAQISAQLGEGPIQDGDLATILVGQNDVIAEYLKYPSLSEPQITANVEAAGAETGRQVNRLADAGSRVLIATIYDVGKTPYGIAEQNSHLDIDRAAMLTRLTLRYNAALRGTMNNDGHRIGIVLLDELIGSVTSLPGFSGFANVTSGVCDLSKSKLRPASSLDCTTLTLIPNGNAGTFLWADDRHLGPGAQAALGSLAVQRAQNNPF